MTKRMFSTTVIDTDAFLDLPTSAQALYFHLGMHGDDDGFVGAPNRIARSVGCNPDDLKLLIAKGFLIVFESGVVVIRDWRLHNTLKNDRYHETIYTQEKSLLGYDNNKRYVLYDTDKIGSGTNLEPVWIQTGSKLEPEWNQSGTKLEPNRNQNGTKLEPERNSTEYSKTKKAVVACPESPVPSPESYIPNDRNKPAPFLTVDKLLQIFKDEIRKTGKDYLYPQDEMYKFFQHYAKNGLNVGDKPIQDWEGLARAWVQRALPPKVEIDDEEIPF